MHFFNELTMADVLMYVNHSLQLFSFGSLTDSIKCQNNKEFPKVVENKKFYFTVQAKV